MSVAELKATPKKEVQVSKPPYFLAYILLAYPASVYEVLGNPQRFLANSTEVTRLADSGRVVAAVCLWTILIALVRFLPDSVIPRWFAVGRKGADALERYGDPLKPATMCVSELHAAAAVIIGLVLLGPDMLGLDGRTWEWVRPMDDGVASYISMFVGYQICDTYYGWAGLSPEHKVHHFAGLLAWGFPLFARTDRTIVPLAYLLAELPNPFLHFRWLAKHWHFDNTFTQINEYIFVVMWIFGRNVPELWACYNHAWFDGDAFPVGWRLTVAVGNILTVAWTTQVMGMVRRRLCSSKAGTATPAKSE